MLFLQKHYKLENIKSLIEKHYMLKLTTNVFSICVHFDHFTSDFGNVKCVATTFKYSLS